MENLMYKLQGIWALHNLKCFCLYCTGRCFKVVENIFRTVFRISRLSSSPTPVDLMQDQQLYNLDGPLDQQHFTVTKLQNKNSMQFSIIYHVFYKFILQRTTHFLGGPTIFLTYWSLDQAVILAKVEHWFRNTKNHQSFPVRVVN